MKKNGFWTVYKIITCILIILAVFLLAYVEKCLLRYEASQPEKLIEAELNTLKEAASANAIGNELNLNAIPENQREAYVNLVNNGSDWTYKVLSGSYSETNQTYGIYVDSQLVAKTDLACKSSEVIMAILTVNDWRITDVKPYVPQQIADTLPSTTDPEPTKEPVEIVVKKFRYTFTMPAEYKVVFGDTVLASEESVDGNAKYVLETTDEKPVFTVTDPYGTSIEYPFGETLKYYDVAVKIPSNFGLGLESADTSQYLNAIEENPKYEVYKDYADMPGISVYVFPKCLEHPEFEITDNFNQKVEYSYVGDSIVITEQAVLAEVPEDIASPEELLKITKMWSLFLTRDLFRYDVNTGKFNGDAEDPGDKGLKQLRKVLVPDSYLEQVAISYSKGVDIKFISNHRLPSPCFEKENVQNFVKYSDDFFSCDISFEKIMLQTNGKEFLINGERDKLNSTCYFYRNKNYDGTEGTAKWLLAELVDNLETDNNQTGEN